MAGIKQHSLVRTIYLYIFALLGLVFLMIGGVRFVDMGLKALVFTKAEEEQRLGYRQPPMLPYSIEKIEKLQEDETLSEEEKEIISQWLKDYKEWQERTSQINYVDIRRHQEASLSLAMILIGLPLYLYHWGIIKRETRNQGEKQ